MIKEKLISLLDKKLVNILARSPSQFGILHTTKLLTAWLFGINKVEAKLNRIQKKIEIRPGTEDHYIIDKFLDAQHLDMEIDDVKYIVDAGAHIGIASLTFSALFPQARILAIEPDEENYRMLLRNVRSEKKIIPIKGALWSTKGKVAIYTKEESWSHRVREGSDEHLDVDAITVQKAMGMMSTDRIDILKMDIEGSEVEVLSNGSGWAKKVRCILVEPHPWIDERSEASITSFATRNEMTVRVSGEDYILERSR
jgi:FkbM family methyltransferase